MIPSNRSPERPDRHAPLDRETKLLRASGSIKVSGVRAKVRAMQAAEARHAARDPRFALILANHARSPRLERIRYLIDPIRQEVDDLRSCLALDRSAWATVSPETGEYPSTLRRAA